MKTSTKQSGFQELNCALKALKKGSQPQKCSQQMQQSHLLLRSSSQASNILLTTAPSNNNANPDIFSQRNSNANLKLQMNVPNKLQKKSSHDHIKRSSIDQSRNKQSPQMSSPRIIENNEVYGCQTSGRKSQYLNNSNSSGNSTSLGNQKQIIGQIKISLAKSKSKTNFSTLSNSQADLQLAGCHQQHQKLSDQNLIRSTLKGDQYKMSRTQSKSKIISPTKHQQNRESTLQSNKKASSKKSIKQRYLEPSQESDRCGINVSEDEEFAHYNDKENFHSNIQLLTNSKKTNSQKKLENLKRSQESLNKKRDSQKLGNSVQQPLLKKKSEGYIENKIPNQQSLKQLQSIQQNPENFTETQTHINNSNTSSQANTNSILTILGRAKSQDKILFDREQNQDQQQSTIAQELPNMLTNSQSQTSMAMMMMILAASGNSNANGANQNNSFNNNANKSLKKSTSKSNLNSQKTLPHQGSKTVLSQAKLTNTSTSTASGNQTLHKQNNSISYLKTNCNNSGHLSKSNTSLLKNNNLNFSRGNLETLTDNTHILLTDHSFTNNTYNQNNNLLKCQQQQQQISQSIPTNSFYRVASSSSISGKAIHTPARDIIDHQIACFSDQLQQNQQQYTQFNLNNQQSIYEQPKKLSVDEYKKTTSLQNNRIRNQEEQVQQSQKSYLNTTSGQSGQNISNTLLYNNISMNNQNQCQNTSNYNVVLNTQSDTQDAASFFKYPNNYNFLLDCKSDTSFGQLGCSSTQKRMLNSSSNRLNTSQHPTHQTQLQSQANLQQQFLQLNTQSSPQRKNSVPYIVEKQPTNSSFSSSQQSGFNPSSTLQVNNINSNGSNNQNILVSQYVQSFNAIRTQTHQSDTNFTFQNNSQNPSSFAQQPITIAELDNNEQREEDQKYLKLKNLGNIQQNQPQQNLDKYATSSFQAKTQEDELLNDTIYRRQSQQIQQQQQNNQANLNNSNQKPFSVLFNNLFNSKSSSKKNGEDSTIIQRQNKTVNQIRRKNSNSLVSQNANLMNLTNNILHGNVKTESSPPENKQESQHESAQSQQTQNYLNSHIPQRNSQGFLPQEVTEKYKYKRTPSLTQFNFSNQFVMQPSQLQSNKNASFELQNVQLFNSKANINKPSQNPSLINDIDKELEQYKQPQQKLNQPQSYQQQQLQQQKEEQEKGINSSQINVNIQNNQNQQQIQNQMQIIYNKMKQRINYFKASEQQWKNEKTQLLNKVESLQNQVNFLVEENSLYKKSVASFNNQQNDKFHTSISSSMEAVLQNF